MQNLNNFLEIFWDENFWLPPNVTWHDIRPGVNGINHADYRDLIWPILLSVILILLKSNFERDVLRPFGRYLKLGDKRIIYTEPNELLEENYRKYEKLSNGKIFELSKKLDCNKRDIERWIRRKRQSETQTKLEKFCDSCWKGLCHGFCFSYGLYALWREPYFWQLELCTIQYPHHSISDRIWIYYMMNLTFYWSLLVTQFFHTKRKDFWEMFLHHIVTVPLIAFSWVCNIHRIGSLIMISLDAAEFFLESAKSFKYTKQKKFSNIGFIIFTIVWIITRLIVFPKLFYITTFETHLPAYPAYYFLNSLLLILLILNIYWTYFILKIIHKVFINQSIQSEIGSSSEESGEEYLKK